MKSQELFLKTDLMNFGTGDLGYIWENDPVKRKAVAKKILPALSTKAIRKMEPTIHLYLDLFISKLKDHGTRPEGCLMNDVSNQQESTYYMGSNSRFCSGFSGWLPIWQQI
jgi:hypothetical protein